MPSIRIGYSTDFNLNNELVGIGSTTATSTLDVAGQIIVDKSSGSGGISSFREYQGFLQSEVGHPGHCGLGNIVIDSSVSGNLNNLSDDIAIGGEVTVSTGTTITGGRLDTLTVSNRMSVPHGNTNSREGTVERGTIRFNQDFGTLEFFDGYNWKTVNSYARGGGAGRTVISGGSQAANYKLLQSVQTTSLGNAISFGELSLTGGYGGSAMSNGIRGLSGGGWDGANNNNVEYVTLASGGNGIDFGADMDGAWGSMGLSSSTRGISGGGGHPANVYTIVSFLFSSTGVRESFGSLPTGISHRAMGDQGPNSPTRGLFCGGYSVTRMESKQLQSDGDTILFGDLASGKRGMCSSSDQTRGIIFPGWDGTAYITSADYVTMASFGNSVNFGDMTNTGYGGSGGNMTRALYFKNTFIEYVEIQSLGNGVDFGDCEECGIQAIGLQDSHGGLGGF